MEEESKTRPKCFAFCARINPIRQRFITAVMACLAAVNSHIMRQCLSPTLTQLVVPRNHSQEDINKNAVCEADKDFGKKKANHGTLEWDQKLQSLCLSSYYIGYLLTHLPGGYLADRFGSKWVLALGVAFSAVCTLVTPFVIDYGDAYGLIGFRVILGAFSGTTYPALSVVLADWVPPRERGFLGSLVMSGGQLGVMISNSLTGLMLERYHWHVVFYVWGATGLMWFVFFAIFCYNSPLTHPCIREKERQYLIHEIGDTSSKRKNLPPPPVKAILTSCPMWSLILGQLGHNWTYIIIIMFLPKYTNDVLQIEIKKNGLLSSMPSFCMLICSLSSGLIADILINRGVMGRTNVRKMMTGIASFGPAVFLIAASYSGCNKTLVIVNFCLCLFTMGTFYGGMKLTPIDMSPNYAGFVTACTNGVGALTSFLSPITVGFMTPNTTLPEWRRVFWLAFTVLVITGLIFCIWGKSDVQPWNEPKSKDKN